MILNDVWTDTFLSLKGKILPKLLVCEATFLFSKSFKHTNRNRNTREILRGERWNRFSHVCVDCSSQTRCYPPQHSNLLWVALHSQHSRHLRHSKTRSFFIVQRKGSLPRRIYIKFLQERLEVQRNSLSPPNFSCLPLSNTNHRTAIPLLSGKEQWKWVGQNQRSECTGKMAHKRHSRLGPTSMGMAASDYAGNHSQLPTVFK